MSYAMFWMCLTEAEERAKNFPDAGVRQRSQETVDLFKQRMAMEGLTRMALRQAAKDELAGR